MIYELAIIEDMESGAALFTIIDEDVVRIETEYDDMFGQYGGFQYLQGENIFLHCYESVGDESISAYTWYYSIADDGKAVLKQELQMQTSFETDESVYYIDGKEVEEVEYNSHLEDNSKNIINLTLDDCTMVFTAEEIGTFLGQY